MESKAQQSLSEGSGKMSPQVNTILQSDTYYFRTLDVSLTKFSLDIKHLAISVEWLSLDVWMSE